MSSLDGSLPSAPATVSPWVKLLWKIGGIDKEVLYQCPQRDRDAVKAAAEIFICTFVYQAALWTVVGHMLFASPGRIRPDIIIVGLFLAMFVLLIDSWMFMRTAWEHAGLHELRRGGLDCGDGPLAHIKGGAFLAVRIGLAIGNAQLTAIFFSLLIFAGDINSRLQDDYLRANSQLLVQAIKVVDEAIARDTDAFKRQATIVEKLSNQVSTLQQGLVDPAALDPEYQQAQRELQQLLDEKTKADESLQNSQAFAANEYGGIKGDAGNSGRPGRGVRYRAAVDQVENNRAYASQINRNLDTVRARIDSIRQRAPEANQAALEHSREQLPGFESELSAENAKLAALKKELDNLVVGRESDIQRVIDSAPDHVPFSGGFLGRIMALDHISAENPKLFLIIALLDVCSFGFELAGVLSKVTAYVPTTYSMIIARDSYMQAVRIADEMMAELKTIGIQNHEAPDIQPADDPSLNAAFATTPAPAANANGASPPVEKRKRGRPRKNPLPPAPYKPQ
jgi:Domain of unknown function (DUF4407)